MDSFTRYHISSDEDKITSLVNDGKYFVYGNEKELEHWLDLSRLIIDMRQLYDMYKWNHSQLVGGVYIYTNGVV